MNNTQKALINQDVCEQTTPNLGITQSSGLVRHTAEQDKPLSPPATAVLRSLYHHFP